MERQRVAAALEARGVSKRFGGRRALTDVAIAVERGEVHGLVGANGSGKSTLAKVLAGYHAPAPGARLAVAGRPVRLPLRPGAARALGLRFVHQELALIASLSVLDNVRMEELAAARGPRIAWPRERRRASEALRRVGLELELGRPLGELAPLERALVAIARAAADAPVALVLDEPTSFLPGPERGRVHEVVRALAGAGAGVLLITHDIAEARALARRVTVLSEGGTVATVESATTGARELAALAAGGPGPGSAPRARAAPAGGRQVSIEGVSGRVVRDVSLELRGGEVVGLTGLAGSGYDELPYLLFGARPARAGRLSLHEAHDLTEMTPARAIVAGIALLPASREQDGAVGSLAVGDNVLLPRLERYSGALGLRLERRRMEADAVSLLRAHAVTPAEPGAAFATLSGGNQQKALVGKWVETEPRLLLLDEPLRGVDAGARAELAGRIRALAGRGAAVLCASADERQLEELCDRVLTFSAGRIGCSPSA